MKTTKPKLNVRLLRKIQKHILEEPRRFFMDGYVVHGKPGSRTNSYHSDLALTLPSCGTAACIAGWANILTGAKPRNQVKAERARKKLGLSKGRMIDLFNQAWWPFPFEQQYREAKTPARRVKIAATRIEHLIKTGE